MRPFERTALGFPKREDERANRIFDALVNSRD